MISPEQKEGLLGLQEVVDDLTDEIEKKQIELMQFAEATARFAINYNKEEAESGKFTNLAVYNRIQEEQRVTALLVKNLYALEMQRIDAMERLAKGFVMIEAHNKAVANPAPSNNQYHYTPTEEDLLVQLQSHVTWSKDILKYKSLLRSRKEVKFSGGRVFKIEQKVKTALRNKFNKENLQNVLKSLNPRIREEKMFSRKKEIKDSEKMDLLDSKVESATILSAKLGGKLYDKLAAFEGINYSENSVKELKMYVDNYYQQQLKEISLKQKAFSFKHRQVVMKAFQKAKLPSDKPNHIKFIINGEEKEINIRNLHRDMNKIYGQLWKSQEDERIAQLAAQLDAEKALAEQIAQAQKEAEAENLRRDIAKAQEEAEAENKRRDIAKAQEKAEAENLRRDIDKAQEEAEAENLRRDIAKAQEEAEAENKKRKSEADFGLRPNIIVHQATRVISADGYGMKSPKTTPNHLDLPTDSSQSYKSNETSNLEPVAEPTSELSQLKGRLENVPDYSKQIDEINREISETDEKIEKRKNSSHLSEAHKKELIALLEKDKADLLAQIQFYQTKQAEEYMMKEQQIDYDLDKYTLVEQQINQNPDLTEEAKKQLKNALWSDFDNYVEENSRTR